jgi:hypothetical protein
LCPFPRRLTAFIVVLFVDSAGAKLVFEPVPVDHPVYILVHLEFGDLSDLALPHQFTSGTTGKPKCIAQGFGVTLNHLKETVLHCDIKVRPSCHASDYCVECLKQRCLPFRPTMCASATRTAGGWCVVSQPLLLCCLFSSGFPPQVWHWLISCLGIGSTLVLFDVRLRAVLNFAWQGVSLWRLRAGRALLAESRLAVARHRAGESVVLWHVGSVFLQIFFALLCRSSTETFASVPSMQGISRPATRRTCTRRRTLISRRCDSSRPPVAISDPL